MLNIIFGRENCPDFVLDTRIYFRRNKKPEWFENPFVKKFLKEIDNATVLFEEALKDYRGRGISSEMISTGCKTLCDIYYHGRYTIFYGSGMGDNCIPFLMEIAENNDITIVLEHYMDFPVEYFERNLVSINGNVLKQDTYGDAYIDWCASCVDGVVPQTENFDISFTRPDGKSIILHLFNRYTYIWGKFSGEGKSEFVALLKDGISTGDISIVSELPFVMATAISLEAILNVPDRSVIMIDEAEMLRDNLLSKIAQSKHLFIIIARAIPSKFDCSLNGVYKLRREDDWFVIGNVF